MTQHTPLRRPRSRAILGIAAVLFALAAWPAWSTSICERKEDRLVAWWKLDDSRVTKIAEENGAHPGLPSRPTTSTARASVSAGWTEVSSTTSATTT
jgi:hypothetical protein